MTSFSVILLGLAIVSTSADSFDSFENLAFTTDFRIVNGSNAVGGQFPHQVSVRIKQSNSHFCGGSILTTRWIISAAHCLKRRRPNAIYAVVGAVKVSSGGVKHAITKIKLHPKYNRRKHRSDIALIQTKTPIVYNDFVLPITLPTTNTPDKLSVYISGWGVTHPGDYDAPDNLQYLKTVTLRPDVCEGMCPTSSIHFDEVVCHLKLDNPYSGACYGDSGEFQ